MVRGAIRFAELPPVWNYDLVAVSLRYSRSVVYLVSALSFHQVTTQIPRRMVIANPRSSVMPLSVDHPPIQAYKFLKESYENGIEEH